MAMLAIPTSKSIRVNGRRCFMFIRTPQPGFCFKIFDDAQVAASHLTYVRTRRKRDKNIASPARLSANSRKMRQRPAAISPSRQRAFRWIRGWAQVRGRVQQVSWSTLIEQPAFAPWLKTIFVLSIECQSRNDLFHPSDQASVFG